MSKRALLLGLLYSILVIVIKLIVLLGGYSLSHFGYYYSNLLCVLLIIPFYFIAIKAVRDNECNGVIRGREAVRVALTVFAVGALLTSIYNYVEFEHSGKKLAIEYYHSPDFEAYLKTQSRVKVEDYPKIIEEQIQRAEVSSFKATTGKLFSLMLIGISGAVIAAAILKKQAA